MLAPPLLSLDVYSYISYARLGADHGLNPYEFAPSALPGRRCGEPGHRLQGRRLRIRAGVHAASYPLGLVSVPVALWSLKAIAGAVDRRRSPRSCARIARVRGVDPALAVAFVALNPLILVHLVGGAHNDALMVAIAMVAVAAVVTARPAHRRRGLRRRGRDQGLRPALRAVRAARTREPGGRVRFVAGGAAALVLIGAVSLAVFGSHVTEALSVAGGNQGTISRWSVPATLSRASGIDVDVFRAILGALAIAGIVWLLVATARGFDWVRAAGWAALAVLVASAYMAPWYVIWLLPVAAISRDRALIGATILFTVFQAINAIPI